MALAIDRNAGESFRLEENGNVLAAIKVVRLDRGRVRLAITADRSIDIIRDDIKSPERKRDV